MIISIYPHLLLYTNVNITLSNIAICFLISFLSIFLVCFVFTLFMNVLETFGLMPSTLHTNIVDLY
jgi:Na+/proline symporter